MSAAKRDLIFVPLMFSVVVNTIDIYSSWFFINYLNLGLAEGNLLMATGGGALDITKAHLGGVILILIQALFLYIAWITRRTEYAKFDKIKQIGNTVKLELHACCFLFVAASSSVIFFGAFIWNPLVVVNAIMDFNWSFPAMLGMYQNDHPFSICWLLGIITAIYWWHSFQWRYLTDEAKKEHRWLQWPYRIGFMKDEIV